MHFLTGWLRLTTRGFLWLPAGKESAQSTSEVGRPGLSRRPEYRCAMKLLEGKDFLTLEEFLAVYQQEVGARLGF